MSWQPIENVPQAEGWYLVWCAPGIADSGSIGVASVGFRTRDEEGEQLDIKEWRYAFGPFQRLNIIPPLMFPDPPQEKSFSAEPTHWMPLPEPPQP